MTARTAVWTNCIAIAEEAFAIGNQASDVDTAEIKARMDRAKEPA